MLVAQEQATLIRCCGPDGCGEVDEADGLRYCIGSNCMAWRIGIESEHQPDCATVSKFLTGKEPECDCEPTPPLGYCGLAKMPEGI